MLTFADFARHPRLARLAEHLSGMSALTEGDQLRLIEAAAHDAGISFLDVEMVQPGASFAVPFAASAATDADPHQEAVRHHVHNLIVHNGGRRHG